MTVCPAPFHAALPVSALQRLAATLLLSAALAAQAQVPVPAGTAVVGAPASAGLPARPDADWQRLPPAQKQALAPLAGIWGSLTPTHQRKWLEVSKNYPSLAPAEQTKMHERMVEWVALSPQQRAQARLNFGKTAEIARELSPAEKLAKWQAYQSLSPEERQKLAEGGKTRPLGAAPAIKPVPPQKLAVVPPLTAAKAPRPAEAPGASAAEASASN